ncbi:MAG: adenosylcobinamide-GDP ribazoletransferase [Candidatus Methanomethylophilaceae archaeon]|nr:adenosylcobinamide-GDP ribazoletransferase [Candidatus Methanomethylophilaceae archaeon]
MRLTDENTSDTNAVSALRGMVSFFTLWHLDITQKDMDSMEQRFHMVPVVGILFGVILVIELTLLSELAQHLGIGSGLLNAAAVLLTVYAGSKFIHFDGLTDFGDGMIVSGKREDHVRALKDTLVGAGGIGVALAVTITTVAVYSLGGYTALLIAAPLTEVLVKNAMVVAAAFGKPGNGMAGRQVAMTTMGSAVKAIVVSIVCGAVMIVLASFASDLSWNVDLSEQMCSGVLMLIVGLIVSWIVGYAMASVANRNFGMVNGDILGATNEICRPAVMFVMLIVYAFYFTVI